MEGGNGSGQDMGLPGDHQFDPTNLVLNNNNRAADEIDYDSRSGSENFEVVLSGDDDLFDPDHEVPQAPQQVQQQQQRQQQNLNPAAAKKTVKKYHRHTQLQINELEGFFKECPHPDEKQRRELSRKLGLESRQIKFWFQNRRTQMKTQLERHENIILRQDNDKLRAENTMLRQNISNPMCTTCGGPAVLPGPDSSSLDAQQLMLENAQLKDELARVCSMASNFLGRPLSSFNQTPPPYTSQQTTSTLSVNAHGFGPMTGLEFPDPASSGFAFMKPSDHQNQTSEYEKTMYVDFALGAMAEMMKMAHIDEPLWIKTAHNKEVLDIEEYARIASPSLALKRTGFVTEATRETGFVVINSAAIVEMLMDVNRWAETFNGMVTKSSTIDVISYGLGGTKDGSLQLMQSDFMVMSPMVPVRQAKFLRFCKQQAENVWAVVDISLDASPEGSSSYSFPSSMRLPSGCVLQDLPNGCCKVTWVEHSEYDESYIHRLLRPVVSSGMGFGAKKWLATLQRYCECLAILLSSPSPDESLMTLTGKKSTIKLANRMVDSFCSGVCDFSSGKWEKVTMNTNVSEDVRIMTRNNINDPGEPHGVVLSASTSVWLPVSRQRLFEFLGNIQTRSEWDILSHGAAIMQEMLRILKAQRAGNCISLLRAATPIHGAGGLGEENSILVLQETWHDVTGSALVYAPVDLPSMELVLNGGDSTFVAMLPSGFVILPDGHGGNEGGESGEGMMSGCILTIGFQILVNNLPVGKLTMESVDTVNNLLACTIQRIKDSLQLP